MNPSSSASRACRCPELPRRLLPEADTRGEVAKERLKFLFFELEEIAMTVTPQFSQEGSILADSVESRLLGIDTELEITTSAPRDVVSKLVATAERMCFMMDAVREPHEVRTRVMINGEVLAS